MTTFELSVIFDSDSEEAAVEAIDNLGAAFTEHLPGWTASVESVWTAQDEATGVPENVRTFKSIEIPAAGTTTKEALLAEQGAG
jgi:hypothetical protein